jgi:hypothetical protein
MAWLTPRPEQADLAYVVLVKGQTGVFRATLITTGMEQIQVELVIPIPEPATMALAGFAMVGAVGLARRRRETCSYLPSQR